MGSTEVILETCGGTYLEGGKNVNSKRTYMGTDESSPWMLVGLTPLPAKNFHAYVYSAPFFMQTKLIEHTIWVYISNSGLI
jgi:hypothetical protein